MNYKFHSKCHEVKKNRHPHKSKATTTTPVRTHQRADLLSRFVVVEVSQNLSDRRCYIFAFVAFNFLLVTQREVLGSWLRVMVETTMMTLIFVVALLFMKSHAVAEGKD